MEEKATPQFFDELDIQPIMATSSGKTYYGWTYDEQSLIKIAQLFGDNATVEKITFTEPTTLKWFNVSTAYTTFTDGTSDYYVIKFNNSNFYLMFGFGTMSTSATAPTSAQNLLCQIQTEPTNNYGYCCLGNGKVNEPLLYYYTNGVSSVGGIGGNGSRCWLIYMLVKNNLDSTEKNMLIMDNGISSTSTSYSSSATKQLYDLENNIMADEIAPHIPNKTTKLDTMIPMKFGLKTEYELSNLYYLVYTSEWGKRVVVYNGITYSIGGCFSASNPNPIFAISNE